jgi:hypothetical protein
MKNKITGLTKTRQEKTSMHIAIKMPDPPLLFLRKQIVNNADWQVFWLGLLLNTFPWRRGATVV